MLGVVAHEYVVCSSVRLYRGSVHLSVALQKETDTKFDLAAEQANCAADLLVLERATQKNPPDAYDYYLKFSHASLGVTCRNPLSTKKKNPKNEDFPGCAPGATYMGISDPL